MEQLLFIALVGFFSISKAIALDNKTSLALKEQTAMDKLSSGITIDSVSYQANNLTIIVNNTGKIKLKLEELDVYVDGSRIPRDQTNRTIRITPRDFLNPTLWDPDESIEIDVYTTLGSGTHSTTLLTEYSTSDTKVFDLA